MREIVNLRYDGEKIREKDGMDAYDVAEAIDGFSDFLNSISQAVLGQQVDIYPTLRGVRPGSIDLQFVFELAGLANTVLSTGTISVAEAIKQAFELFKHLKGQPPKSIKKDDKGSVAVENNSGNIIVVNQPIVNVVVNGAAAASPEKFARRPLHNDADNIQVKVNGELAAEVSKASADDFQEIGDGEKLGEFVADQHLTVQTAVLEGDGNWRFGDGRNKFRAEITDKKFLQRIRDGKERFGRGGILHVRLRSRQEIIRGQLRTTHIIEEVLGHEPFSSMQLDLV